MRCVSPDLRAVWIEAAESQFDAASALAHAAVSYHYGSAILWQQASPHSTAPLIALLLCIALLPSHNVCAFPSAVRVSFSSCGSVRFSLPSLPHRPFLPSPSSRLLVCSLRSVQWFELEDMRGNTESVLRIRALASSAGVHLAGDGI